MILNFNDLQWRVHEDPFCYRHAKFVEKEYKNCQEYFWLDLNEKQIFKDMDRVRLELNVAPNQKLDPSLLNYMHSNFANLVDMAQTKKERDKWSELNDLIHKFELAEKGMPPRWGYTGGQVTYKLPTECYPKFTVKRKFGDLFISYAHVGKHFAEIVQSQDLNIPRHQIVPQFWARADFFVWLGETVTDEQEEKFLSLAEKTYNQMQDKMPYRFQDPKLAIGYIPFASLVRTDLTQNDIVEHLRGYK